MSALAVQSITAGYGAGIAIEDVCVDVRQGACVVLLGANGAGKTTLLRSIAGQLKIRGGKVLLNGVDVSRLPAFRRTRAGIALVPEGRRLFPLSVKENLLIGMDRHAEAQSEIDRVVELFPILGDRLGSDALGLSGGEQQMLAIARALVTHPKVLLLDEPSVGLAPKVLETVNESVLSVLADGTSVLMAEQNLGFAKGLATDVALIEEGRVIPTQGDRDRVFARFAEHGYFSSDATDDEGKL